MSDMGDAFRDLRDDSQKRRAHNRHGSAQMLTERGVSFQSKNDGAHLIVEERYDFWPGTGRWSDRQSMVSGRGVTGLLRALGKGEPAP